LSVEFQQKSKLMISDGVVTVMVSDMDRAVEFYVDKIGLKLEYRAENHWAQVETDTGFKIGLHPASPNGNPASTRGSILIGWRHRSRWKA
jgi:catechol 2,3-dioxygenase-like lactoylglutathione lyase family enzyme